MTIQSFAFQSTASATWMVCASVSITGLATPLALLYKDGPAACCRKVQLTCDASLRAEPETGAPLAPNMRSVPPTHTSIPLRNVRSGHGAAPDIDIGPRLGLLPRNLN